MKISTHHSNSSSNRIPTFPTVRLRRLRRTPAMRELLQETHISVMDLICPIFIEEGITKPQSIISMPDIQRLPLCSVIKEVDEISKAGIRAIIVFGIPSFKDKKASSAYDDNGIVQRSIEMIRKHFSDKIVIITDVCLCQYTSHGHCGIAIKNKIDNDNSIKALAKVAVSHAQAGADIVAPSAMMDGQVSAIRTSLDKMRFEDVAIMGYSAKQASPMYAPFRDAAHSTPIFGDRRTYQMPFTNPREAIREIEADVNEGADIIMIKPAIPYLDLIYQAKKNTSLPICAYSVSGEYALVKAASHEGWINENDIVTELLTSIKRAGADIIITYHAMKMAQILNTL